MRKTTLKDLEQDAPNYTLSMVATALRDGTDDLHLTRNSMTNTGTMDVVVTIADHVSAEVAARQLKMMASHIKHYPSVLRLAQPPTEPTSDYDGLCPHCQDSDGYLNIGKLQLGVCHEHKVYWRIGENAYESWRGESEKRFRRNEALLNTYERVEPFRYPAEQGVAEPSLF